MESKQKKRAYQQADIALPSVSVNMHCCNLKLTYQILWSKISCNHRLSVPGERDGAKTGDRVQGEESNSVIIRTGCEKTKGEKNAREVTRTRGSNALLQRVRFPSSC